MTSATTGDTSEFATAILIPPPPPYSFLKVELPSPPLTDRKVSVNEKSAGLIELKLSTGITSVAVTGLKLTLKGSLQKPEVVNATLWEDKNGNGKVDPGEQQIAGAADATIGAASILFDHLRAMLPAATETRWLLAGDFTSQALGQTVQVEVSVNNDVVAATSVPGGPFAVIGDFPVAGPRLSVVTVAPLEKAGTAPTPATQGHAPGNGGVFKTIGQVLSSIGRFFAGLFKR